LYVGQGLRGDVPTTRRSHVRRPRPERARLHLQPAAASPGRHRERAVRALALLALTACGGFSPVDPLEAAVVHDAASDAEDAQALDVGIEATPDASAPLCCYFTD